ncbi:hypothetical protein [Adonisia turfae]|uniref:Uncharacterized protein n=1 Tax=Adonisia turfae CCMR0081 TaxID=2292702 RepID=A0A6M0RG42_9CYAN|nr:hypothetical protein [Adonisia turfae]NEZ54823.1 hypothetical protein [Adonisia turfae CCMR0081]
MSSSVSVFKQGNKYKDGGYEFILNGEVVDKSDAFCPNKSLRLFDRKIYDKVSNYSMQILLDSFSGLSIEIDWPLNDILPGFRLSNILLTENANYEFFFDIDIINWEYRWSASKQVNDFVDLIVKLTNDKNIQLKAEKVGILGSNYDTNFPRETLLLNLFNGEKINLWELPLKAIIDPCIRVFTEAQQYVIDKYQLSLTTYSLTEHFNFPPEVKTACEQYLLYFAEFLKDVGIKVSTNITEEDQDVILTVIPENKDDALEKIGHLLNLYLHLPNGTLVSDYQLNTEMGIQAQKLYGQIKQLESQLSLTNAENQLLQLTVDSLNRELKRYDSQILLESKAEKEKDKEPVIGNPDSAIVSLTEIDIWGVNVNLANLLRALKNAVRGD